MQADEGGSPPDAESNRLAVGADVAAAIDAVAAGPVLVVGSPPPGGRDLDLLARPDDYAVIRTWLDREGFIPWRHTWARFGTPGTYAVELSTTSRWRTSRQDASSLFVDVEAVPGFSNLVTPAPATVLLLAARGTVTRRGRITDKIRRRVSRALERDPEAWNVAQARAGDLGLGGSVQLLRAAYESGGPLSPLQRIAGMSGVLLGDGPVRAKASVLWGARPRRVRPAVVSFSGLDGSGKSTQVTRLQEVLGQLGVVSETQWAGFKTASKLRHAVPLLDRPIGGSRQASRAPDKLVPTALRDNPVGRHAWVFVVVGFNLAHLWRLVLRRRSTNRLLIFDRFSPDSMVKLDLHFLRGRGIDTRWQGRLFTLLSPKPDVGFFVDVSSDVAYSRRQEQTPEELMNMRELYQEQVPRFGLHRLDGTEAPADVAHQVATAAWRGLR